MIYCLAFLMNFITGMLIFGFPMTAIKVFDAGVVSLGALGMAGAGFYALVCLFSGRVADRFGSRRIIFTSCVFLLLVCFLIYLVSRFWHLLAISMLFSLGAAHFWPALMKWVGETEGKDALRSRIGFFNVSWSAGIMLGPLVSGTLFARDFRYPFLASAAVVASVILLLVLARGGKSPIRISSALPEPAGDAPPPSAGLFLSLAYLANFSSWFSTGASQSLFPRLAVVLEISPQRLGALMATVGLANLIMFIFLRRTRRWHYNFVWLAFFQALALVGMGLLAVSDHQVLFALAFFCLGTCAGMTYFSSLFYSLHGRARKGRSSGYHEAILGLGVALGPLTGGLAAGWFGLRAPYLLCAAVIVFVLLLQLFRRRRSFSGHPGSAG